jgi:hypothetical protein
VGDWRAAGITEAGEAVRWHEMGFTLDAARVHKRQGRGPVDAFRITQSQSQPLNVVRLGSTVMRNAMGAVPAVPGNPFQVFHQAGVDPRAIGSYMQRSWVDEEAVEWARRGIEAQDAYLWFDLGLRAAEAGRLVQQGRTPGDVVREWWTVGIPYEEAAEWIGAGLSAVETAEQRANGVTVEHAASLRALRLEESESASREPMPHALLARMGPPRVQEVGPPPQDEKAARAAVDDAYANMMTADETGNVRAVAGGSNLGHCLDEARERHRVMVSDNAPGATAKVDMLRFVNDHEARVLFTLSVGPPVNQTIAGRIGRAVLIDGEWKVARETFCEFMQMAGVQCPPPPP